MEEFKELTSYSDIKALSRPFLRSSMIYIIEEEISLLSTVDQ